MTMYFKADFYFFLRNFRYRNITSFKRSGNGTKNSWHNPYGRQYAEQNVISYLPFYRFQSKKEKRMSMLREAFGHASFGRGPRVLESKNTPLCYLNEFCEMPMYQIKNRPVGQHKFGITLSNVFALKSLTQKRSSKVLINKASQKDFLFKVLAKRSFASHHFCSTKVIGYKEKLSVPIFFFPSFCLASALLSSKVIGSTTLVLAKARRGFKEEIERDELAKQRIAVTSTSTNFQFAYRPPFNKSLVRRFVRGKNQVFQTNQLKAKLSEKKNFSEKATKTERRNNTLSGEVFKESFTDILQTSLEQVGFSLELHNKKSYKPCRATLWKQLQVGTNRRVPFFTRLFFSFWFSLFQKKNKTKKENFFFPRSLKLSHLYYHQSRQALLKQVKDAERKQNYSKKLPVKLFHKYPSNYKFFVGTLNKSSIYDPITRKNTSNFTEGDAYKSSYKSSICTCTYKGKTFGDPLANQKVVCKQSFKKQQRKRLCSTKFRPYWEYKQKKKTKIALTIKIGDFLSSGDKIGEKASPLANYKKRILQKDKSLIARTPKLRFALRNKASQSEITPLCSPNLGFGVKAFSQNRRKGKKNSTPIILGFSGRVVTISKTQAVFQKTQPVLFYKSANLHVKKGSWVKQGAPILTLTHQTLITGDIVQGIPRIEQLFEAFTSPPPAFKDKGDLTKFKDGYNTLHSQVRDIFRSNWLKNRLPIAVRKSLEEIGYILVEMIQKVYLSQGVLIADKHIEIIVRQIASKGQILDSGTTGLFLEEVLPVRQIENANLTTPGKKCLYVPAVMGLTAAALNSDSFISAASFQETTRVLSRDAVVGKSDFLRGLKEKVVIGDLISAGTGLDLYFIYTTMLTS